MPPGFGWALRATLSAALLLLVECAPGRNQFAPVCPIPAILGNAADMSVYRSSARDLSDLVVQARIARIQGSCQAGDTKNELAVKITLGIDLFRGPAMAGRATDIPVFVAVTEGDRILDKRVYLMRSVFPSNVDRITLSPGELAFALPVTPEKSGAAYTILAGFQLTSEQMEENRRSRQH